MYKRQLYDKGTYYWYGEHKVEGDAGNRAQVGVHCYSCLLYTSNRTTLTTAGLLAALLIGIPALADSIAPGIRLPKNNGVKSGFLSFM